MMAQFGYILPNLTAISYTVNYRVLDWMNAFYALLIIIKTATFLMRDNFQINCQNIFVFTLHSSLL